MTMKSKFILLSALLFSATLFAETYTIVFNSNENADGSNTDKLNDLVLEATNNCVENIRKANKVARAKPGFGIKGGIQGTKGELTIGLDDTYHITTMTVYTAAFVPADGADTASNKRLIVCEQEINWTTGHRAEILPYQLTINQDLDSITIAAKFASKNRWYVQKIEFEAENPHPTQPIIQMQYASLNFEPVSWYSADEPMEDALAFEVSGKNLSDDITLSLQNGSKFTVAPTSIPASGSESSVSYSITMSSAPNYPIIYKDTILAFATGSKVYKLPVELTIKPKSSGASTFDLDTTRMSVGPMPGDYYKYAQNTADSMLKNHLGYIICCGKRYRYGSGSKKSWDAFFHTDRDTITNEVLDMYSNNHRYFNPEQPTASVAGFDIEHMLPKSWWGGDVNPAYCDIYHLVPGDASANRSKSNHAPGIPADSSFNNGSFITGRDTLHGLTRVFCPADEYKGDFARAYFYIAACYGDSLQWVESKEPAVAMTNEGWQEFQPWLRDLLLDWHRLDPVSEKEKARAIEVNKIQGNRNPFIDYPDLVEYIWGNKQGQAVDFRTLDQSYGDQYDDTPTGIVRPFENGSASKQIHDGKIVILRNASIYTTLGQQIR